MKIKKGFTLIELLVVISIIALLLSILMPALGRAKEMAAQIVCSARLKNPHLAMTMYATDNNERIVGWPGWRNLLHVGDYCTHLRFPSAADVFSLVPWSFAGLLEIALAPGPAQRCPHRWQPLPITRVYCVV